MLKQIRKQKHQLNNLIGELSNKLAEVRKYVMDILVDIEASIDYPEYDVEEVTNDKTSKILNIIEEELIKLEKSFENGKIIKEGIKAAIVGRPNAGKSSLLNAILGEERAIVTDIEGTTRDTIEEFITIEGIPVKIIDTAGIRDTNNTIEKIGIDKSRETANDADLVIAIIDSSKDLEVEDNEILDILKSKKGIVILNKIDKDKVLKEEDIKDRVGECPVISISALNKIGINNLYEKIAELYKLNEINIDDSLTITNERHKQAIRNMRSSIDKAKQAILDNMPIDIITINITDILEEIGKITGEGVSEDIINEIFKKFCLGK